MKNIIFRTSLLFLFITTFGACKWDTDKSSGKNIDETEAPQVKPVSEMTYMEVSEGLLTSIKAKSDISEYTQRLAKAPRAALQKELDTDAKRIAFWLNVYNSYIQIILSKHPELYDDRGDFFSSDQVAIAGETLSFDKIEHGIIRSSTMKLSKGYIGKFFPGQFEKDFRVQDKDPRIHFALNCGAKDCPPVFVYNPVTLDKDLDQIAAAYLKKVSKYDAEKNEVVTTPLFKWFTGDFGGKDGVREMLRKYGILPEAKYEKTDLEYADYDWTLDLNT